MTSDAINSGLGLAAISRSIPPTTGSLVSAERPFERHLAAASERGDSTSVRKAATEFVSTAFIRPVLSALRESSLRPTDGPFANTTAEKRFGPLLDERLADQITGAARFPLIDTIIARVMRPGGTHK